MTPQPPPGQGPIESNKPMGVPSQPAGELPRINFPPGWNTPKPPPPRRFAGLVGSMVTAVAVVLFAGSLLLNVWLLATRPSDDDASVSRKVVVKGESSQVVAVVPIVTSLMTDHTVEDFDAVMKEVDDDKDVKAVVLRIDTPGGEVTAADEIYHRIETYKTKHPAVPVVVSMGGMATSGGYYAACAADYLVAEPTTLTGNIGVLLPQYNFAKLAEKYGVDDDTLHSTGADFKTAGSPLRTPTTQETDYLRHLIDEDARQFHSVVKKGRANRLKSPEPELFDGKAYSATDALTAGLVDQVGMADAAYAYAAQKAGLTSMKVVRYEASEPLLRSLISSSAGIARPAGGGSVGVGAIHAESPVLDALFSGRPLYYYSAAFH
jgi:protease-4